MKGRQGRCMDIEWQLAIDESDKVYSKQFPGEAENKDIYSYRII